MYFVVYGHQSLLSELHLSLGLGFGSVVLFAPMGKLLVHGLNVVVDELDGFAQRCGVLADTLDHALDQLKLFVCQLSA